MQGRRFAAGGHRGGGDLYSSEMATLGCRPAGSGRFLVGYGDAEAGVCSGRPSGGPFLVRDGDKGLQADRIWPLSSRR
ncbi:hypothetical protein TIFTF001_026276 [Ficus carica]|uniref:Uncharacterized protein n=1 Tax=Ficus carica TaxID=3494 RepID=A0AA88IYE3_FICCA|nr:hypothetical protein TIFTF001_026276 [Ficus carica]